MQSKFFQDQGIWFWIIIEHSSRVLKILSCSISCQQVPSGLCSSLAQTGYYVPAPDRNTTVLLESFVSVNTSSLLSCQTGLLKLACDYYYPPCHPLTFQQIGICGDSCESVALIQTSCPSMVENIKLNVPSEVLGLDCFNPSSYLVEDVTVSQDQCIDLSTYSKVVVCSMMLNHAVNHSYSNEFGIPNTIR